MPADSTRSWAISGSTSSAPGRVAVEDHLLLTRLERLASLRCAPAGACGTRIGCLARGLGHHGRQVAGAARDYRPVVPPDRLPLTRPCGQPEGAALGVLAHRPPL